MRRIDKPPLVLNALLQYIPMIKKRYNDHESF